MCATLASVTMMTSTPAFASAEPLPLLRLAPDDAPASVLGLDSKDGSAGKKLTVALRKAFANRGLSGGEEISLEEMRLTMGCTNDGVDCLAEGGRTLGVRRLIFGYLAPTGGGYQLDIQILDVKAGTLEAQASMPVTKADLADGTVDATAVKIVNELMPPTESDTVLPPRPDPLPEVEPEPEPEEPEDPPREKSGIWVGLEKPTPRWKWVGFGTALGLTVAAAGVTIGTGVWITASENRSFGFRQRLIDAAMNSQRSPDPFNRVDTTAADICVYNTTDDEGNPLRLDEVTGEQTMDPNGTPGARNSGVDNVCRLGTHVRRAQIVAGAATGVFGLTTLIFTGLLFIHKRKPASDAMLRRGLTLGIMPRPEGGVSISSGLRF